MAEFVCMTGDSGTNKPQWLLSPMPLRRRAPRFILLSCACSLRPHGTSCSRQVVLDVTWADPHGGQLTETFEVCFILCVGAGHGTLVCHGPLAWM